MSFTKYVHSLSNKIFACDELLCLLPDLLFQGRGCIVVNTEETFQLTQGREKKQSERTIKMINEKLGFLLLQVMFIFLKGEPGLFPFSNSVIAIFYTQECEHRKPQALLSE